MSELPSVQLTPVLDSTDGALLNQESLVPKQIQGKHNKKVDTNSNKQRELR